VFVFVCFSCVFLRQLVTMLVGYVDSLIYGWEFGLLKEFVYLFK